MATVVIPTDTGPDTTPQVLRLQLDGVTYQLTIRYNSRAGLWRVDIADDNGTALASGLSLRNAGIPANGCIFGRQGFPPGILMALATADPATDANLEELGGRVQLVYIEAAGG